MPSDGGLTAAAVPGIAVLSPSAELVVKVSECICPAMFIAGTNAYLSCLEDYGEEMDVGELVSRVYAAMRAQELARDQQWAGLVKEHGVAEPAKLY